MTASPRLRLVRLPGEFGPVIRCSGELTVATVEALHRELALLAPMAHFALTINVAECSHVDVCGALEILESYAALQQQGRHLAVVVGSGTTAHTFRELGISASLPLFATEEAAAIALRGDGLDPVPPPSWEEARKET